MLSVATLGYEWDEEKDNGARPPGLMHLCRDTVTTSQHMLDDDLTSGAGVVDHELTLYRHASGASCSAPGPCSGRGRSTAATSTAPTTPDRRPRSSACPTSDGEPVADMGVQTASLQTGHVVRAASTEIIASSRSTDRHRLKGTMFAPGSG